MSAPPPHDDVLVVGAGPAGSVAARELARAGLRVTLVDRSAFPRPKLCGDTLNPGTVARLERLGLEAVTRGARLLTGMRLTGPGEAEVIADYPGVAGAAITRARFDAALLDAAVAAGVRFVPGVVAEAVTRDATGRVRGIDAHVNGRPVRMTARCVIAADGRGSRLARTAGLQRPDSGPARWAYGMYVEGLPGLDTRGEMHLRADGYVGVAPLGAQVASVCIVRTREQWRRAFAAAGGRATDSAAVSRGVEAVLGDRWRAARPVSRVVGLGPLGCRVRAVGCPGLVLAGDAAGFVDPITGDGIGFAVRGGELAASAVLEELRGGRPAANALARARSLTFGWKVGLNRGIRRLTASPVLVGGTSCLARYAPAPIRWLAWLAGDVPVAGWTGGRGIEASTVAKEPSA